MILQPVTDFHAVWGPLTEALWRVKEKCDEPWRPEDVIFALGAKTAFLYAVEDQGFVVFQRHQDADVPVLFIWIMAGELWPYKQQLFDGIDELARGIGARRIRWHSPRKAWQKIGYGKMKTTIYERDL